jgi:hypothetical protein
MNLDEVGEARLKAEMAHPRAALLRRSPPVRDAEYVPELPPRSRRSALRVKIRIDVEKRRRHERNLGARGEPWPLRALIGDRSDEQRSAEHMLLSGRYRPSHTTSKAYPESFLQIPFTADVPGLDA